MPPLRTLNHKRAGASRVIIYAAQAILSVAPQLQEVSLSVGQPGNYACANSSRHGIGCAVAVNDIGASPQSVNADSLSYAGPSLAANALQEPRSGVSCCIAFAVGDGESGL
jgi:hypothetical protein